MSIFNLALKSLWNRKFTAGLTAVSIGLSVTLLLGVQRINSEAKASFTSTISGTDLIVGARTGAVQLLLYSVFRIGYATNNISWETVEELQDHPKIDWIVPISLGDSHRGYRVMGTSRDYFERYRFSRHRQLVMAEGEIFDGVYDAVLGSEVAKQLGYELDDEIIIAHGAGEVSLIEHDDKPFQVVGILDQTGTPVDQTVHVSLEGIEAIHIDWKEGAPPSPGQEISAEVAERLALAPQAVTAVLVGLNSRIAAFEVQRFVNTYRAEPLLAILPGVTLQSLWEVIGVAERALSVVSGFVVMVGLSGMLVALLTSLNERRREMAILRSVGARPIHVFALIVGEAGALTIVGVFAGVVLLYCGLWIAQPLLLTRFGLAIAIGALSRYELVLIAAVCTAGTAIGMVPGYLSYRQSLVDGMSVRQ
ncbi:MAG: ABC transporter permease [Synechococcus sp.]